MNIPTALKDDWPIKLVLAIIGVLAASMVVLNLTQPCQDVWLACDYTFGFPLPFLVVSEGLLSGPRLILGFVVDVGLFYGLVAGVKYWKER